MGGKGTGDGWDTIGTSFFHRRSGLVIKRNDNIIAITTEALIQKAGTIYQGHAGPAVSMVEGEDEVAYVSM